MRLLPAWRRIIGRIAAAAQKFVAGYSRQKPEPPRRWLNLAPHEPIPVDPADHAEDFAHRWVGRLENATEGRMHALDIPEEQIGSSDHMRGVAWRVFFPHERDGGGNGTGGRLNVDSGVLNPELLTRDYGEEAGALWAKSGLRDRIDAIIIHEKAESRSNGHEEALARAPQTGRPISDRARQILVAMREGWKGRG
jgi:hypothetical protein